MPPEGVAREPLGQIGGGRSKPVALERGNGSADAIRKVGGDAAQIGFANAGSLVLARANDGIPVRMVAALYAAPPHAI